MYAQTPLHVAVSGIVGGVDVVQLLIQKGAKVNARDRYGRTPLHLAVYSARPAAAQLLPPNRGHAEVLSREDRAIEQLLARGADVRGQGTAGLTPAGIAERKGYSDIARLLRSKEK